MKAAFPQPDLYEDGCRVEIGESGMTLRDYFAAKALAAIISKLEGIRPEDLPVLANDCFEIADAMLKAREEAQ